MRYNRPVDHRGDVRPAVLIAVIEVWTGLVIVLHEVREREVAHAVLNHHAGRREDAFIPRPLSGRDVETCPVVPTVVVTVVIDVPRIERVGSPVVFRCDIVHAESCVTIFPSVGNTITVRIRVRRVGDASKASVEVLIFKRVDFRHPIHRFRALLDEILVQGLLCLKQCKAELFLIGRHGIFTKVNDS